MKTKNVVKSTDYVIFSDLDGVLADLIKGLNKASKIIHGDNHAPFNKTNFDTSQTYRKKLWNTLTTYQNEHDEMWANLDMMSDGQQLWDYIKNYNSEILSATSHSRHKAAGQKRRWVKRCIDPNVKVNLVQHSRDKAQFAKPNHILIDDSPKSINPWIQAGGIGILHKNTNDTIKQLKKLGL